MIEAINGKADSDADGFVTLRETDQYIARKFKDKKSVQEPKLYSVDPSFYTSESVSSLLDLKLFGTQ